MLQPPWSRCSRFPNVNSTLSVIMMTWQVGRNTSDDVTSSPLTVSFVGNTSYLNDAMDPGQSSSSSPPAFSGDGGHPTVSSFVTFIILLAGVVGGLTIVVLVLVFCKYCLKDKRQRRRSLREEGGEGGRPFSVLQRYQTIRSDVLSEHSSSSVDGIPPSPRQLLDVRSRGRREESEEANERTHLRASYEKDHSYDPQTDGGTLRSLAANSATGSTGSRQSGADRSTTPKEEAEEADHRCSAGSKAETGTAGGGSTGSRRVSFQLEAKMSRQSSQDSTNSRRYTEGDFHYLKYAKIKALPRQASLATPPSSFIGSGPSSAPIISRPNPSLGATVSDTAFRYSLDERLRILQQDAEKSFLPIQQPPHPTPSPRAESPKCAGWASVSPQRSKGQAGSRPSSQDGTLTVTSASLDHAAASGATSSSSSSRLRVSPSPPCFQRVGTGGGGGGERWRRTPSVSPSPPAEPVHRQISAEVHFQQHPDDSQAVSPNLLHEAVLPRHGAKHEAVKQQHSVASLHEGKKQYQTALHDGSRKQAGPTRDGAHPRHHLKSSYSHDSGAIPHLRQIKVHENSKKQHSFSSYEASPLPKQQHHHHHHFHNKSPTNDIGKQHHLYQHSKSSTGDNVKHHSLYQHNKSPTHDIPKHLHHQHKSPTHDTPKHLHHQRKSPSHDIPRYHQHSKSPTHDIPNKHLHHPHNKSPTHDLNKHHHHHSHHHNSSPTNESLNHHHNYHQIHKLSSHDMSKPHQNQHSKALTTHEMSKHHHHNLPKHVQRTHAYQQNPTSHSLELVETRKRAPSAAATRKVKSYEDVADYDVLQITEFSRGPFYNTDFNVISELASPTSSKVRYNDTGSLEELQEEAAGDVSCLALEALLPPDDATSDETVTMNGSHKNRELWHLRATLEEEEECSDTVRMEDGTSPDDSPDREHVQTTSFESTVPSDACASDQRDSGIQWEGRIQGDFQHQQGGPRPAAAEERPHNYHHQRQQHHHHSHGHANGNGGHGVAQLLLPSYENRRQTYRNLLSGRLARSPAGPCVVAVLGSASADNSFDSVETDGDVSDTSRHEVTTTSFESTTDNTDSTTESQHSRLRQMQTDSGYKSLETQQSGAREAPEAQEVVGLPDQRHIERADVYGQAGADYHEARRGAGNRQQAGAGGNDAGASHTNGAKPETSGGRRNSNAIHFERRAGRTASKKRREYSRERQVVHVSGSLPEPETDSIRSDGPSGDSFEETNQRRFSQAVGHHQHHYSMPQAPTSKRSIFTRFFSYGQVREKYMVRDYSIDEKTNQIFNEFLRDELPGPGVLTTGGTSCGRLGLRRSPRSQHRPRLQRKHTEPLYRLEDRRRDRLVPEMRSASLGSDSSASSVRRLSPQDSIEEEYEEEGEDEKGWIGTELPPTMEVSGPDGGEGNAKSSLLFAPSSALSSAHSAKSLRNIPIIQLPEEELQNAS